MRGANKNNNVLRGHLLSVLEGGFLPDALRGAVRSHVEALAGGSEALGSDAETVH